MLQAHVDVVPTGDLDKWVDRDPFSGAVHDGIVHGRGACDMKAGAAANLAVAHALVASGVALERPFALHSVVSEEDGGLGAFATMTLLTKNSFLDEIRKQYVMTARAKGCTERQVLYNHIFRNAMLIVIAGFPGAFIHAFFSGSLLIETIFSLDGLGLLGFESVLNRDYPVVFGTLFIFSLVGLVVNLASDLTYMWIDPRIDFEAREV